ncbi:uncharacterized protein LOC134797113 [Cydia splendana]|uniref:uncharacterized protein LOC134797113 n=1 Tax=Cydia splendana TaxID=1100963 RepID=UPI0021370723
MEYTPAGRTRAALAEIPLRLDRLRVSPPPAPAGTLAALAGTLAARTPLAPRAAPLQPLANTRLTPNARERSPALPPGYLSPAASPDELLIQQRGRKRLPVTWSPDIDLKRQSFHSTVRTPPKALPGRLSPPKLGVTLRSTPRKRLILDERIPLTPEKIDFSDISTPQKFKITSPIKGTPPIKRPRIEKTLEADFKSPIDMALKGLSPTQLINVIKTITYKHPEIEKEIRMEIPVPDLAPLEERLSYLKSNIFKSLPSSRLTSKTDSPAYSRVATHLGAFKKCVIEQGKTLVESQHWNSVMDYVFLAWSYVRATPVWDHQPHNATRKQCFKALINFCMSALKKATFDREFLVDVQDKLQGMVSDAEEIQSCLKHVQGQLQEFSLMI